MKSLHISLKTAHSGCKPTKHFPKFLSSIIHTFYPSLPSYSSHSYTSPLPPPPFYRSITKSSTLIRSRCPNHLNLPCLTTSATLCILKRLYKSTLSLNNSTHPSHHHSLQAMQILSLHRPFVTIQCLNVDIQHLIVIELCKYTV